MIDALLKAETPYGPAWRRYNDDGYGEHEDGSPYDGTGIGRAWPLLTGERDEAKRLLQVLEAFANEGGMIPEQIWDAPDILEQELFFGRPSGSAMPLAWAYAEHIKLLRSLHDGRVFDMPSQTAQRYLAEGVRSPYAMWRFNHKCRTVPAGRVLRIEVLAAAIVHWNSDGWQTASDTPTRDTGLGIHVADVPTDGLSEATHIVFTLRWIEANRGEGRDFTVTIAE